MNLRTHARRAAACSLAGAILTIGGISAVPAAASPSDQAVYLDKLKASWNDRTPKEQRRTCLAYRDDAGQLVALTVDRVWTKAANRDALRKREWRTVLTTYLAWACSGPDSTPR